MLRIPNRIQAGIEKRNAMPIPPRIVLRPPSCRHLAETDSRDAWILALLVVAFALSRIVWLAVNPESAEYWEESYRWMAAHEILTGSIEPLLDYQADHYQGGSLVMIGLVMGSFLLWGESVIAMKLAAVIVSSCTLCLLYLLGRKLFGRPTAIVASLAYLAGPPLVAYWGLTVMGSHGESILFSLAQLLIFFEIRAGRWRSPAGWALLGLVSGVGLWFCYTSGLTLIACGLAWLLWEPLPRPRELLSGSAGGLVGLVPWLLYNQRHGFVGLSRIFELFGFGSPVDPWVAQGPLEKLAILVSRDLPVGLLGPVAEALPQGLGPALILGGSAPYAIALIGSAIRVGGLWREGTGDAESRRRERVFLLYALVFLGVFLGSRFSVEPADGIVVYRLFVPPAVLLMLPAAHGVSLAWRRGGGARWAALVGCGICLVSFATATVQLASREIDPDDSLEIEGGYVVRGLLLHRKFERDLPRAFAVADRAEDPRMRFKVIQGIGWGFEYRFEQGGSLKALDRYIQALPLTDRVPFVSGFRWIAGERRAQVRARVAAGDDGSRTGTLLARLKQLRRFADDQWERIPSEYHLVDEVSP
ncbi:MAG: glycosyltransferase family 39 protein [Myxococcales bacterium]|nr:glycosyltransferase family 39 protein [Myxococcales bacterium]